MNIAVIFGGESCEHDISIITGVQLINKVNEYLYNVYPIYIDKKGQWFTGESLKDIDNFATNLKKLKECSFVANDDTLYIKKGKVFRPFVQIDCAIVCLHGQRGEDGSVAGILELSKIPYSSSSMCASSVCMDKCVFKTFAKGLGVNVVEGVALCKDDYDLHKESVFENVSSKIGFPCIVKPSRQGSSIGIQVCYEKENLHEKLEKSFEYDSKLLIERFVKVSKEVNVALFENKGEYILSSTEEPVSCDEILSFDNKYRKNSGGFETIKRIMPASITDSQSEEIKNTAIAVYRSIDMFGVVRFDFLIDEGGKVFLNEVNTIPGSMANYLFDKEKYSYPKLIELLISSAVHRFKLSMKSKRVFDSGVLHEGFDGFKK